MDKPLQDPVGDIQPGLYHRAAQDKAPLGLQLSFLAHQAILQAPARAGRAQLRTALRAKDRKEMIMSVKCTLILHGSYKEIDMGDFPSKAAAKRWVEGCWNRPYSIRPIKTNKHGRTDTGKMHEGVEDQAG